EIFDYIQPGEELVQEPFQRLMVDRQLIAYKYDGFWLPMDTAKDKKRLDDLYDSGDPPWFVWKHAAPRRSVTSLTTRIRLEVPQPLPVLRTGTRAAGDARARVPPSAGPGVACPVPRSPLR